MPLRTLRICGRRWPFSGPLDMKKEFRDFAAAGADDGTWLEASAKNDRRPYEKVEMLIGARARSRHLKVTGRDQSAIYYSFERERT